MNAKGLKSSGIVCLLLSVALGAGTSSADPGLFDGAQIVSFSGLVYAASCQGKYHFGPSETSSYGDASTGVFLVVVLVLVFVRVAALMAAGFAGNGDQGTLVWTYTCEVTSMDIWAMGRGANLRRVSLEGQEQGTNQYAEFGVPCEYAGTPLTDHCTALAPIRSPTPAGAQSGKASYPYDSVPKTVDVCINPAARAVNAPQHVALEPVKPSIKKLFSEMSGSICLTGVPIAWTAEGASGGGGSDGDGTIYIVKK